MLAACSSCHSDSGQLVHVKTRDKHVFAVFALDVLVVSLATAGVSCSNLAFGSAAPCSVLLVLSALLFHHALLPNVKAAVIYLKRRQLILDCGRVLQSVGS